MPKITFLPDNIIIERPEGSSLLEAARMAGVYVETPCGGKGTCQKCLVNIIVNSNQKTENKKQSVLICQTIIPSESITVELPDNFRVSVSPCFCENSSVEFFEDSAKYLNDNNEQFVKRITLQVAPAALLDGLSDADRFTKAFLKEVNCQAVEIPLNVMASLPEKLREKDGEILVYFYTENNIARIVFIDTLSPIPHSLSYGIAIDIGTTTVALVLADMDSGKVLSSQNTYNSQIECGLDVISRINYAKKNLGELKNRILKTIDELLLNACKDAGIEPSQILCVSLAGNTTMIHLFLGIMPEYIRLSPYTPAVFKPQIYTAEQAGIGVCKNAPVLIAPAVGSYVGGDITSGLLCTSLAREAGHLILFIDIGTNGEIVLGGHDFIFACACSAGPAFEGGGIKHGMRAQNGAIDRVSINENGKAQVRTIGGAPACGICGSGIISAVAQLFRKGIIDCAGKFADKNGEYTLCEKEGASQSVTICEADIDNFIRTKGAIFSACQTLLDSVGMNFRDIERVYVAGGFGSYLDLEDARTVGLLPRLENEKFTFLGNSSAAGAYLTLLSERQRLKERELAEKITYMDLSSEPKYMEHYTGALFLPHTDKRLFE